MKTSRIVALASLAATIALVIGATIKYSKSTSDVAAIPASAQIADPDSTVSLEPVVVTAKR